MHLKVQFIRVLTWQRGRWVYLFWEDPRAWRWPSTAHNGGTFSIIYCLWSFWQELQDKILAYENFTQVYTLLHDLKPRQFLGCWPESVSPLILLSERRLDRQSLGNFKWPSLHVPNMNFASHFNLVKCTRIVFSWLKSEGMVLRSTPQTEVRTNCLCRRTEDSTWRLPMAHQLRVSRNLTNGIRRRFQTWSHRSRCRGRAQDARSEAIFNLAACGFSKIWYRIEGFQHRRWALEVEYS
jgi:hypothetical protein